MATPIAAGAALLIRQYFTDGWYPTGSPVVNNSFSPSGALIKAAIVGEHEEGPITQPTPVPNLCKDILLPHILYDVLHLPRV